jgi:alkylation response protein AidB-like acyl-CoA dehydrogenase
MDLRPKPEHEALRTQLRAFITEYGRYATPTIPGQGPGPELLKWQRLLLEYGYAGRTVPREYGGYGATPDVMAQYLIIDEFTRAGIPLGIGNQGISMLVPTLLELGTEEQKREFIAPTLRGELVWCQGYSEPGAGSDLASLHLTQFWVTKRAQKGKQFVPDNTCFVSLHFSIRN